LGTRRKVSQMRIEHHFCPLIKSIRRSITSGINRVCSPMVFSSIDRLCCMGFGLCNSKA
jgi:hypothetical protein